MSHSKSNVYVVFLFRKVYLDENNNIKYTECECPRGTFKCSHAAAIFVYGIHNLSRTDTECQWKKKKSTPSVEAASEMFPPPKKYNPLGRQPAREDRAALYDDLKKYGNFTGLWWIMSPEPAPAATLPVTTVEEVIYSEEFLYADGQEKQLDILFKKMRVQEAAIKEVSLLTLGQRDNPSWHLIRRGRLTASNFGCVLKAKRVTPSLIKRLLGEYYLSGVKAIAWGVTNEEGVKAFSEMTGLTATDTGIWLHSSGVLGASPDGLVGTEGVLEVKCPYSERNSTISEAASKNSFCLKISNGVFLLKQDHVYWHQVQGQLFLTNRKICYFVVWTTKEAVCIHIYRDESWMDNLKRPKDFYSQHIFPKIVEGEL